MNANALLVPTARVMSSRASGERLKRFEAKFAIDQAAASAVAPLPALAPPPPPVELFLFGPDCVGLPLLSGSPDSHDPLQCVPNVNSSRTFNPSWLPPLPPERQKHRVHHLRFVFAPQLGSINEETGEWVPPEHPLSEAGVSEAVDKVMAVMSSVLRCQPQPRLFGGLWSYKEGVSWYDFEGSELAGVYWTKGRAEACVDLRGGGCDRVGIERQLEFIRAMLAMGAKCRRVDTAWDDFLRVASMHQIHTACELKNLSMYRAYKPVRDYRDVVPPTAENPTPSRELIEDQATLGLRGNWGSGRYVRIYDKFLETGKDPKWNCIRYEIENTDDVAEAAIEKLATCNNAVEYQACVGGLIAGSLNFVERWRTGRYEANLKRCKPLAWWTAVLSKMALAGAIVLNISADYRTLAGGSENLEKRRRFFMRDIGAEIFYNMTNVKSDRIKEFVQRAPFAPFDIRTADGRVYSVDHPEFLSVSRKGDTIVYFTEDDRIAVIDCSQIVSLKISNRPTAA